MPDELGRECPCPGPYPGRRREGRCEEGTGCDRARRVHDAGLWGAPWGLPAPVRGERQPAVHAAEVTPHTVSCPVPQGGPSARASGGRTGQPLYLPQEVAQDFQESKAHPFPPRRGPDVVKFFQIGPSRERTLGGPGNHAHGVWGDKQDGHRTAGNSGLKNYVGERMCDYVPAPGINDFENRNDKSGVSRIIPRKRRIL